MTMTPGELERKVRQLDHDVQEIYEMLAGISATQTRQGNRLDQLERKMESRFDAMDTRFDGMDRRFDGMDTRFDGMDRRFDALERRVGELRASVGEILTLVRKP